MLLLINNISDDIMCRQCLSKYFANTKVNIIERKLSLNNVYIRYDNLYEVFSQKNSHTWIATNDCLSVLIKIYILHSYFDIYLHMMHDLGCIIKYIYSGNSVTSVTLSLFRVRVSVCNTM